MNNDLYLTHHGIKGMKWGVRRYQNSDGSYTPQGKARRNSSNSNIKQIAKKVAIGLGAAGVATGGLYLANKVSANKSMDNVREAGGAASGGSHSSIGVSAKKSIDNARKAVNEAKKLGDENLRIADEESKRISNPNISREEIRKSFNKVNDVANKSMDAEKKAYKAVQTANSKNNHDIGDDDVSSFPYRIVDDYMPSFGPGRWFTALKTYHPDIYESEYKKADDHWTERERNRAYEQAGTWTPSPLEHADIYSNNYLAHHGIRGMKWGVRRFEDASGHLTPAGKRRYAVQDARKYYKINRLQRAKENTKDADKRERLTKRLRRVQTRSDRKHADLTSKDLNIGRQIVAKNRRNWAAVNTAAKTAATAAGAYALYQNPKTRALAPLAVAAGGAATFGSAKKLPYYTMEARRYKQVNPKGATTKGLTKSQKALRKAGKVAATAALAGAAGYALAKSGAVQNAVDRYKGSLPFDKATKVSNAEQRIKNAFGIKTGRQRQKEQMAAEEREANNRSNNFSGYQSTKSGPSDATRAILDANQRARTSRKVNNGTATIRSNGKDRPLTKREQRLWNVLNGTGKLARNGISKASNAAGKGISKAANATGRHVRKSITSKLVGNVDYDDPRTWVKPISNAKEVISDAKRYKRAAKAVKNKDAVNAITELAPDITAGTNRLIEKSRKQVSKFRRK